MSWKQKIRLKDVGVGAAALVILNAALVATLLFSLFSGTEADEILATKAKTTGLASSELLTVKNQPVTNLEIIQTQPLFHATRAFYVAPDPATVAVTIPPPDYRIVGAMTMPNKPISVFLVHNQTSQRTKVQKGDALDGWTVEEANAKLVVLSMNGTRAELTTKTAQQSTTQSQAAMNSIPTFGPSGSGSGSGIHVVSMGQVQTDTNQGGLRVLTGGTQRPMSNGAGIPPRPSNDQVAARLYRPPPAH